MTEKRFVTDEGLDLEAAVRVLIARVDELESIIRESVPLLKQLLSMVREIENVKQHQRVGFGGNFP